MNSSNTTDNSELPFRFREKQFRTYEPIIAQVIKNFPEPTIINPKLYYGLSAITFACRFRDAMSSYSKNKWASNLINREKFDELFNAHRINVVEKETAGIISIGDKKLMKGLTGAGVTATPQLQQSSPLQSPIYTIQHESQLDQICHLASTRLLSGEIQCQPVTIVSSWDYQL